MAVATCVPACGPSHAADQLGDKPYALASPERPNVVELLRRFFCHPPADEQRRASRPPKGPRHGWHHLTAHLRVSLEAAGW